MKKQLVLLLGCGLFLSACLVVGPRRGSRRQGTQRCHPSETWDGHKCKHKKHKAKKHKHKGKKHKGKKHKGKKHEHR